jgi:Caudovirus prohead serine protease
MPQDAPVQILEVKSLDTFEIKDDEKGEIEAVIATLGVVDHDHDIITKDAIADGAAVKLSDYGHSVAFGALPVGKGNLRIKGNKVLFEGHYFKTPRGRESFDTVKAMGIDQEWSFGFSVKGDELPGDEDRKKGAWRILTKLDSFEVSPVIRGAGIGTRTVLVKAAGANAPPELPAEEMGEQTPAPVAEASEIEAPPAEPEAQEDPAEAERKAAEEAYKIKQREEEAEAQRKLQAEIDAEVERFQRTARLFNL